MYALRFTENVFFSSSVIKTREHGSITAVRASLQQDRLVLQKVRDEMSPLPDVIMT